MSEQSHSGSDILDQKQRPQTAGDVQPEQTESQVEGLLSTGGLSGATSEDKNLSRVSNLANPSLQTALKQTMVSRIGQVGGNRYLQRVINKTKGSVGEESEEGALEEQNEQAADGIDQEQIGSPGRYPSDQGSVLQLFVSRHPEGVVQRDVHPVGGTQSQAVPVQRPGGREGQNIAPGASGYSRAMLAEVPGLADELSPSVEASLLTNVVVNTAGVEGQLTVRGDEKNAVVREQSDFMNTPSTTRHYQAAVEWIDNHVRTIGTDRDLLQGKAAAYNAWVPRANGFFTSATRMGAMQGMLGATDNQSMVAAIRQGLTDAQSVAQRMQGAYAQNNRTEQLTVPAPDQSVQEKVGEVAIASEVLNNKWLGWKVKVDLVRQARDTEAEGNADRTRLAQINEAKQAIHNIGATVDVTMAVVSGAPAAIQNVQSTVQRGEAMLNASRNRSQILAGRRPTHNPTYLTTDAQGNMVVRNAQTNMDRDAVTGATTASPESQGFPALPVSVASLLDGIATFVYASEVRQINNHLEVLKTRLSAVQGSQAFLGMLEATNDFQTAVNNYARLCNDMQNRLAARRDAYLVFGEQLDRFARTDRESQQNNQAPEQGQERFAQIMTVVAQIRELVTLGTGAVTGFDSPANFRNFANEVATHRQAPPPSVNYRIGLNTFQITRGEVQGFNDIYRQVGGFNNQFQAIFNLFGPIEAQAATVMALLSPGGGRGGY